MATLLHAMSACCEGPTERASATPFHKQNMVDSWGLVKSVVFVYFIIPATVAYATSSLVVYVVATLINVWIYKQNTHMLTILHEWSADGTTAAASKGGGSTQSDACKAEGHGAATPKDAHGGIKVLTLNAYVSPSLVPPSLVPPSLVPPQLHTLHTARCVHGGVSVRASPLAAECPPCLFRFPG